MDKEKSKEIITPPTLIIRRQTVEEEFDHLLYILKRVPFYREKGYEVVLPKNSEFVKLANNPRELENVDKERFKIVFMNEIYEPDFFSNGLQKVESERGKAESVFSDFISFHQKWGFKLFDEYKVKLTRYGTGGSYDYRTGSVKMMTREDGSFRRSNPLHTVVHEMIHMGIEENIIRRFDLTHWEKERLVDKICINQFSHILIGYREQPSGDRKIDAFLNSSIIKNDVPTAISEYVTKYPRD